MAGIEAEPGHVVDGTSFVEVLRGEAVESDRNLYWHYPNFWGPSGPGIGASSTVRKGDWKLIYYHQDQSFELFNIAEDIGETRNRFEDESVISKELASDLGNYLRSVDATMPYDSSRMEYIPWPDQLITTME